MKRVALLCILSLSTISCASFMEGMHAGTLKVEARNCEAGIGGEETCERYHARLLQKIRSEQQRKALQVRLESMTTQYEECLVNKRDIFRRAVMTQAAFVCKSNLPRENWGIKRVELTNLTKLCLKQEAERVVQVISAKYEGLCVSEWDKLQAATLPK